MAYKAKSVNGADLMLWIGGKVVALSTSCTINLTVNTEDSQTKDDGLWSAPEVSSMAWDVSNESVYTADEERTIDKVYDDLLDLSLAGEPVDVTYGIPANANKSGVPQEGWTLPAGTYGGQAMITSLSLTGAKGSKATVSVSLAGYGALTKLAE